MGATTRRLPIRPRNVSMGYRLGPTPAAPAKTLPLVPVTYTVLPFFPAWPKHDRRGHLDPIEAKGYDPEFGIFDPCEQPAGLSLVTLVQIIAFIGLIVTGVLAITGDLCW